MSIRSEKEKQAIEIIKQEIDREIETPKGVYITDIKILLNLLENDKKEIEKFKWKPISEYNRKEYDWVLVKYFDGDYECVPNVAEMRNDGKWYTYEKEIPFEIKYFFDMQELLEE